MSSKGNKTSSKYGGITEPRMIALWSKVRGIESDRTMGINLLPRLTGPKDLPAGSKATIHPILEEERGNILRSVTCSWRMLLASGHRSDFSLQTKLCCKRLRDDYPLIRLVAACRCQEIWFLFLPVPLAVANHKCVHICERERGDVV